MSGDGRVAVSASSVDSTLKVLDLSAFLNTNTATERQQHTFRGHSAKVNCVAVSEESQARRLCIR